MKTKKLFLFLCIALLTCVNENVFSQATGLFTFPATTSFGEISKPSNDGNIISAFNSDDYDLLLQKTDLDGAVIWDTEYSIDYGYPVALFSVPGEGYVCFTQDQLIKFSETGDDYSSMSFTEGSIKSVIADGDDYIVLYTTDDWSGMYYGIKKIQADYDIEWTYENFYEGGLWGYFTYSLSLQKAGDNCFVSIGTTYTGSDIFKVSVITGGAESVYTTEENYLTGALPTAAALYNFGRNCYDYDNMNHIRKSASDGTEIWDNSYIASVEIPEYDSVIGLRQMVELESGNLLGCNVQFEDGFYNYNLQGFSSAGDLLFSTAAFFPFALYSTEINNMTLLDENTLVCTGTTGGSAFILMTDTLGNYKHFSIAGRLYNDLNANGIYDAGEIAFPGKIITATPGPVYAVTNSEGAYNLFLTAEEDYTVSSDTIAFWDIIDPSLPYTIPFDVSMLNDTITDIDFRFDYTTAVIDISTYLYFGGVAPGFEQYSHVTVKNIGNQYDISGTVKLHLPHEVLPDAGSTLYTIEDDTVIVFTYSGLDPYEEQHYYDLNLTTDIDAVLGDTVMAYAYADPMDLYPANNADTVYREITSSFDPNHKLVSPAGESEEGYIDHNTEYLTYTIEFQNTGTAPAQFINIYDTLSEYLDMTSIEMLSASHNYKLYLTAPGLLRWEFDSIMLPDLTSDLMGSMGFLKFRIKIKDEASIGDIINNTASIYFDYNSPIITNTTKSTLADLTEGIISYQAEGDLIIYPNPFTGNTLHIISANQLKNAAWELCDITGKKLAEGILHNNDIELPSALLTGSQQYILTIKNENQSIHYSIMHLK